MAIWGVGKECINLKLAEETTQEKIAFTPSAHLCVHTHTHTHTHLLFISVLKKNLRSKTTAVLTYLQEICPKNPSGCQIVPNHIYVMFFLSQNICDKFNL